MTLRSVRSLAAVLLAAALVVVSLPSLAWGPQGHHTIGAVADRLIEGSNAAQQVHALLGGAGLQEAAVWADCAKGIDPSQGFAYVAPGRFAECARFEHPAGEAEMSDYVRRNDFNCQRRPTEESCHKQYHYSDIAIQRARYSRTFAGAREDDIVAAVSAAIRVLRGEPAPPPFRIQGQREALLLLAHFVGDVHQPLHVGAVYLDRSGRRVDPDAGMPSPQADTRGGNRIQVRGAVSHVANLHAVWDAVPASLHASRVDAVLIAQARGVSATPGDAAAWPVAWATETQRVTQRAIAGLQFSPAPGGAWSVALPTAYDAKMAALKKRQLVAAGARLAQVLQSLWP